MRLTASIVHTTFLRVVAAYEAGRIAERALYRTDGSLKQRVLFRYDAAGNWTTRVSAMEYDVKTGEAPRNSALLNITSRRLTYD